MMGWIAEVLAAFLARFIADFRRDTALKRLGAANQREEDLTDELDRTAGARDAMADSGLGAADGMRDDPANRDRQPR